MKQLKLIYDMFIGLTFMTIALLVFVTDKKLVITLAMVYIFGFGIGVFHNALGNFIYYQKTK